MFDCNSKRSRKPVVNAFALVSFLALAAAAQAAILRVDGDLPASGIHDGLTWATAYKFVQDALAEAFVHATPTNPYQIWVAAAAQPYRPDQEAFNPNGSNDPDAAFGLLDYVSMFGGFAGPPVPGGPGGETDLNQRNYVVNETVLSGNIDNQQSDQDNSHHVVAAFNVGASAVLDGFTISGGYNVGFGGGAGILIFSIEQTGPVVVRCKITGNHAAGADADGGGAAVFGSQADPVFVNCSFIANSANEGGALAWESGPGVTLVNCLFANNSTDLHGGAIDSGGNLQVINCTFVGNTAPSQVGGGFGGGAIWAEYNETTIINSILWGNEPNEIQEDPAGGNATVSYSDVEGGVPPGVVDGGGNVNADPRFVNASAGDYRLSKPCSPCVDAGHSADGDPLHSSCAVPAGYSVPCALSCPGTGSGIPCDNPWDVDQDGTTGEPTPDLRFPTIASPAPRILDGEGDAADDPRIDMGAYEFVRACCPWDCQMNHPADGRVGTDDLNTLLTQWGQTCTTCDFGAGPDGVGTEDRDALLAHWGNCGCAIAVPVNAAGSESEVIELSLEEALAIMGFDGVDAYITWGQQATEAEVYASTVLLLAIFGY